MNQSLNLEVYGAPTTVCVGTSVFTRIDCVSSAHVCVGLLWVFLSAAEYVNAIKMLVSK